MLQSFEMTVPQSTLPFLATIKPEFFRQLVPSELVILRKKYLDDQDSRRSDLCSVHVS